MAGADRPNILWVCSDQQRHDTIAALGNAHISTPVLDSLAAGGVAFRRAYSQSQICTPSRATFLTGRYPASHHVHRNGNAYFPPQETLVTKLFAEAGYDCGLIGKLHLSRAKGHEERTDDGYGLFAWSHHPLPNLDPDHHAYHQWLVTEKGVDPVRLYDDCIKSFCGPGVPADLHQSTWMADMAIRFIEQKRDGPWLLSLNPFDPHPPFDPPPDYLARYDPETLPPPLFRAGDLERQEAFVNIAAQALRAVDPDSHMPDDLQPAEGESMVDTAYAPPARFNGRVVKAAYYAMIELLDHQIGRILEALEATGQRDNTIVLFHSDHGEMLGDHGLIYKGCRFFEGLLHVPLMVSWPGRLSAGRVSDALVELVDLPQTLLQAAGLPALPGMQGKSLWPLLEGEAPLHEHKNHVVAHYNDALGSTARPMPTHASMYFDGRHKMAVYHGENLGELFDLHADPGEFDNLWDDPAARDLKAALLYRHLDAMMATSDAGIGRIGKY